MACTLLRIVQAAVSLRRRFECAIHSSFESVESGGEEQREREQQQQEGTAEDHTPAQPRAEDLTTSEHLSRTFRLTFEEGDPEDQPDMTFLRAAEGQEGTEGGTAYTDAPASTSIDVIEDVSFPSTPASPEDTSLALALHSPAASALPSPEAVPTVFPHVSQTPSPDSPSTPPLPYHIAASPDAPLPEPIPKVQVHEVSGSERSNSDSDSSSSSRCSVKSVRLRCGEAVSPSSGCKPAKLIRSDAMVSSAEREASGSMRWMLMLQDSGTALLKEAQQGQSQEQEEQEKMKEEEQDEERRGSDSDGTELMAYSEWLMKGKQVLEWESSSGDENETRTMSDEKSEDNDEEEQEQVEVDFNDYLLDDDDSEEEDLADEGDMMVEASFEDSFVDDGFVSLEVDDYDDDVIIEENEEDLERERMEEEMMLEIRRNFQQRAGRGVEAAEHRRLSRQYSPALYLPGIPESKVIQEGKGAEGKEEAQGGVAGGPIGSGRIRHSSSRTSRSGKRSQRSPPVQRQRCIQLEGGQSEEDGAAALQGRAASRPHQPPAPDSRSAHFESDVSRVAAASPPSEVPLVVVATAEGGTRTQALGRSRGRLQHPSAYSLSTGGGELHDLAPRTHAYHKYGSASFDLARPTRHEGARAAFHTTRSSFEGDRRLSMSFGGARAAAEALQPVVTLERSPGSARRLPSMEAASRSCGERQLPEGPLRGGFRRSRSERVGGSSMGVSPARSESLRLSRTRPHPQDVEMTELCAPRRLLALDEYSSSSRLSPRAGSSPSGGTTDVVGDTLVSGSAVARYSWRTAGDVAALRQSSLENSELEDLMENRRHVEQRRLRLAADSTTPSDEDEEPRGKVRYNDTGSLEQVNEELADHLDEPDLTSRQSQEIKVQCRALWQLRTTLEEEDPDDQDSDSGRMEIHSSPDRHSPGRASDLDNVTSATSHTTSFESNTDAIVTGEGGGDEGTGVEAEVVDVEVPQEHVPSETEVSQTPITLPSSEARRTSYRAILANRLKQLDAANRPTLSSENSFDSVDTECSSTTDLSRPEVVTTSFDSTTDCPTDSTSDTHSHRLQQMKADSGYRSLEANNGRPPKLSKKQIHFVEDSLETPVDDPERDRSRERQRDPDSHTESREDMGDPQSKRERLRKGVAQLERRWSGKSHTKKRREALRERHASLDTALSMPVGGSLEGEGATTDELSGKRSVLARFLRTHRYPAAHYRLLQRDYSIDEKSDRLFKEFSRTEVPLEWEPPGRRGPRLYSGRRLHRHLDAEGSPRSHRRKLSPQDSIEEEDQVAAALWEGEASRPESFADSIGCEDLPVSFAVAEEVE